MAKVLVQYPTGPEFDLEYYMKKHMPLVEATWGPEGLQNWEILKFSPDSQYQIVAVLTWDSLDAFKVASQGSGAEAVFGDIKNFTSAQPLVSSAETVPRA